jgi:hypothetical protein
MGRRKSSEEAVLGGSDRPFRRVDAMLEGRNMLKRDVLGIEESGEGGRSLVI